MQNYFTKINRVHNGLTRPLLGFSWRNYSVKYDNITPKINEKIGRNIFLKPNHPINIIKTLVEQHFLKSQPDFKVFDSFHPKVSTKQNFDDLLIPLDHVSRGPSDTYYYDENTVLRTHTTAHQVHLIKDGHKAFLVTGDVYRRDEIDATHYPVFHQMDGVKVFKQGDQKDSGTETLEKHVELELKKDLEGVVRAIFGADSQIRWNVEYFPFTDPSFELEVYFNDHWMEVLGCGVIRSEILKNTGYDTSEYVGYAFGIGLERLAMKVFEIPDIRLFWSQDNRFLSQFKNGEFTKFKSYSKYPACYKDISFWTPSEYNDNSFYELVRDVAGDLVETVKIVDEFKHPKTQRVSKCFRINYRSMDRSLSNEEVDQLQWVVRERVAKELMVELR
ncbi:phenylalanyl tRS [Acrasis kona]|uniref:phenylalanine--tRNA ligase n=1 Tax=Acrasis kona TaxID=1008807 RepID=A0AAW2Z7N2_9EUKA